MTDEHPVVEYLWSGGQGCRLSRIEYTIELTYAGFAWSAQATYRELAAMRTKLTKHLSRAGRPQERPFPPASKFMHETDTEVRERPPTPCLMPCGDGKARAEPDVRNSRLFVLDFLSHALCGG